MYMCWRCKEICNLEHIVLYVCIHIYICLHTYIYTCICAGKSTISAQAADEKLCVCVCIYIYIYIYMHTYIHIYMHMCRRKYDKRTSSAYWGDEKLYIYIYMYIYIYIHTYIHAYVQAKVRQAHEQRRLG
jgi:hypothetical protein